MSATDALPPGAVLAWALPGLPEVVPGDDLVALILTAAAGSLRPGDVLVVTSKIVSKAEGRIHAADTRAALIEAETARAVATVHAPDGPVPIVENHLGIVQAAAGVDASNTERGTVLTLPRDPDRSAAAIRAGVLARAGIEVGVLITDTAGRAWRLGQTDLAIGSAGVALLADERGQHDSHGAVLSATVRCLGDQIAGAADLVKGKRDGLPVAVLRGLAPPRSAAEAPPTRELNRPLAQDAFWLGSAEALRLGWEYGSRGVPLAELPGPGTGGEPRAAGPPR